MGYHIAATRALGFERYLISYRLNTNMYGEIQENNNAGYRVAIKPGHRPMFCCLTIFGWVGARNVGLIKMLSKVHESRDHQAVNAADWLIHKDMGCDWLVPDTKVTNVSF